MMVELALAGSYLGYFPELTIAHHLATRDLRVLTGLAGLPTFDLRALTRRGVAPKRGVVLLMDEIKKALRG